GREPRLVHAMNRPRALAIRPNASSVFSANLGSPRTRRLASRCMTPRSSFTIRMAVSRPALVVQSRRESRSLIQIRPNPDGFVRTRYGVAAIVQGHLESIEPEPRHTPSGLAALEMP